MATPGPAEVQGCPRDGRTPTDSSLVLISEVTLWASLQAGQLHLCHRCRVECGVMGIKTCLHASHSRNWQEAVNCQTILSGRQGTVYNSGWPVRIFVFISTATGTEVSRRPRQDESEFICSNWYGHREETGLFLQLLSTKVIKAWNFPWVSLPSNAGACWGWHCVEKSRTERGSRDGESPDGDFAGTLGIAISKTIVDFSGPGLCWENLIRNVSTYLSTGLTHLEIDFCHLQPRVLHNTFECFTDTFVVGMEYSRVLWSWFEKWLRLSPSNKPGR